MDKRKTQNKNRQVDRLAGRTLKLLESNFVLMKKSKIRAWTGLVLAAFVAGLIITNIWMYSNLLSSSSSPGIINAPKPMTSSAETTRTINFSGRT